MEHLSPDGLPPLGEGQQEPGRSQKVCLFEERPELAGTQETFSKTIEQFMKTRHWRQAQGSRSISDPESREVGTARQSWCWVHNFNLGPFQGVREARSLHAGSEDSAWAPLEQGSRARTQAGPSIHDGGLYCATGPFTWESLILKKTSGERHHYPFL